MIELIALITDTSPVGRRNLEDHPPRTSCPAQRRFVSTAPASRRCEPILSVRVASRRQNPGLQIEFVAK